MDKYMNEYKAAVESVSAERDIVSAAKARIGRKERTYCIRHTAAAFCAVLILGGTTAYAAHTGWLESLFGSASSAVSENISDYSVRTTAFEAKHSDDSFPYDISFGDVICDGTILYGEMHISNKNGGKISGDELPIETDIIINGDKNASRQTAVIFLGSDADGSADAAFSVFSDTEICEGASVEMTFFESTAFASEDMGTAVFTFDILGMPQTLAKHISIGRTAHIGESNAVMQLEDAEISPLRLSVKGRCTGIDSVRDIEASLDIRINFSDGSCLYTDKMQWKADGRLAAKAGERICETSGFSSSQVTGSEEYDVEYNASFRCVIPVDEVVSVTVGGVDTAV